MSAGEKEQTAARGRRVGLVATLAAAVVVMAELIALPAAATAAPTERGPIIEPRVVHDRPVSSTPVNWTPQILDGRVFDTAQVGDTVVTAGQFTQVAPSSGSPVLNRTNVVAFSAINGAINTNFAPSVSNGQVRAVEPGPTADTVYLAGSFTGVNGVSRKVVLMNVNTGAFVPGFTAPTMNGAVNDIQRIGNRLYVAGVFTTVGGQPFNGLVSLNATTGAREDFISVALTENQNYTGQPGQAQGPVGAKSMVVTPQGDQMAVIGNFRKADGLERRQMVLIDLTGPTAVVRDDWKTNRLAPACFSNAFDSYVRQVNVSPDGDYFLVAATGGPNPGSLCDTVSRWNVVNTGQDVQPEWIDDTGGDTLLSVSSSGAAVYTGGHQRWMNNAGGRDYAAPGAVARPGLGAVDTRTGVPIAWNPGRSPRGAGAEVVYPTTAGLWVGSDTEQIGHYKFRRPRIAFFPVTGGVPLGVEDTGSVPGNVYKIGAAPTVPTGDVLYRVNAGGPALASVDGGPNWTGDDGGTNPLRNSGSNAAGWSAVPTIDSSVPASTPSQVFDSERWDPNDAPEMAWSFPVPSGQEVVVRLYLANRCDCTAQIGQRAFDVRLEGNKVLENYDIVSDVNHNVGTMKSFTVTSDGTINLEWLHKVENPLINGIEILKAVAPGNDPQPAVDGLARTWFTDAPVTEPFEAAPEGDVDWTQVRGAVVIDDVLYYGTSDRNLMKRTFDGTNYGPATAVNPYNDPYWDNINTGSGQTYVSSKPSFYNEIPSIKGMAYDNGRLYYTRSGSNKLFSRAFSPDSGVITQAVRDLTFTTSALSGIFFDEDATNLYYVTADGNLSRIAWNGQAPVGSATLVSGPGVDGVDWRGNAVFLADGPTPPVNQAPVAAIASPVCDLLECVFDGSGSSDPDAGDSVVSYLWDFGDGNTSTEVTPAHVYAAAGDFTVTLTVADQSGLTGSATYPLHVSDGTGPVATAASLVGTSAVMRQQVAAATVPVPAAAQAGDLLVLFVTANQAVGGTGPTGAGDWTLAKEVVSGTLNVSVFTKVADGSEAGQTVTMTMPNSSYRTDLTMLAYRGVGGTGIELIESAIDANTASHTSPALAVPGEKRVVLSFWADRSSSTTSWTAPGGVDVVSTQVGSGGGRVSSLITSQIVDGGSYGGLVATTDAVSARGAALTLTLAPTVTP